MRSGSRSKARRAARPLSETKTIILHASKGFSPLKVGAVLYSGATIKTGPGSIVDLFLGNSAGVVRITENTTLGLDKLAFTDTGVIGSGIAQQQ